MATKSNKVSYTLYTARKATLRISNDAFAYFAYGEDPLDTDNELEIEGLKSRYPHGFEIDFDSVQYPKDAVGKVEVSITPYTLKTFKCDCYMNIGDKIYLCVDFSADGDSVNYWWFVRGQILDEGTREILVDERNKTYFITRNNARIYLNGFKKYAERGEK